MKRLVLTFAAVLVAMSAFAIERSQTIVNIDGQRYYIHSVGAGETIYAISKLYDVAEADLMAANPELTDGLKSDSNIKVPLVEKSSESGSIFSRWRKFEKHEIVAGETLYSISREHQISIEVILEDNPQIDPTQLVVGEQIRIRRKSKGESDEMQSQQEWEQYRKDINKVAPVGFKYHIVKAKETKYSLGKQFEMSIEQLDSLNDLSAGLKAGAMVLVRDLDFVVPVDSLAEAEEFMEEVKHVGFKARNNNEPLHVALLLPLTMNGEVKESFVEFYRGFLLGLDHVKRAAAGRDIHVNLYDTQRDTTAIKSVLESYDFDKTDLIVGPVYSDVLPAVVAYAEQHSIPVVSPLATVGDIESDVLFQMAADPNNRYDKIGDMFGADREVTLISTDRADEAFKAQIIELIGDREYTEHIYKYEHPADVQKRTYSTSPSDLTPFIGNKKMNTIVVLSDNETDTDRVLSALASAYTNIVARSMGKPEFEVIANSKWNNYHNLDRSLFFKDNLVMFSTYYAKRSNPAVHEFDNNYIAKFNMLPSLYSYRGYDAAMIFVEGMYSAIEYKMQGSLFTPLQNTYRFEQGENGKTIRNTNWMRVNYNRDFTTILE